MCPFVGIGVKNVKIRNEKLISSHEGSHDRATEFIKGELEKSGLKDAWFAYMSTR
jgi:hypothetical protein